jgi:hypothetical protein
MRRTLTTALIAFTAFLGVAGTAHADTFVVTGLGDPGGACTLIQPTIRECTTLRSAVAVANELTGPHAISLPVGTIQLTAGQLALQQSMSIGGTGARTTIVDAGLSSRVFAISGGATVTMTNFTVSRGNVSTGEGGNMAVSPNGGLLLSGMRVTGGVANRGAGILNNGTLLVQLSLLDGNNAQANGGAIANIGTPADNAEVQVINSTLTGNYASTASAISSFDSAANTVQLAYATVARNTGSAFWFQHAAGTIANATIIGPNANSNNIDCDPVSGGQGFAGGSRNIATGSSCELDPSTNSQNADPKIAAEPTNEGGATNVLTIAADSPAIDAVTPCSLSVDQRGYLRYTTFGPPCDAGAYERSGVAPAGGAEPTPQPPTPTPTATPEPTPVANQTVVAREVRGTVRVRLRGTNRFVDIDASTPIRVGSEFDARRGTIEITAVSRPGRPPEKAEFRDGIFLLTQSRGITDLKLTEALNCRRARASTAQRKPKKRKLWGKGTGKFRTTGSYSAATIRGTEWLVQDTCTTTFTRVRTGVVAVRDKVKKRTIIRRAGQTYTARARRR